MAIASVKNYAQSCMSIIEKTWKDQALKPRKATQLVSMVTCRPYPDDVMGREKKGLGN